MDKKYQKLEWTEKNKNIFWDYETQFDERYFTYRVGGILIKILSKYFSKAQTVLDYGAGKGHLLSPLIERGFKVSALEFSDQAIIYIKSKFKDNVNFKKVYSINEIKNTLEKFDVIFLVEIFEHLNEIELDETITIIKKLLSPKGVVIISTPNDEKLEQSMICCPECQKIFHRWQHIRSWNENSLRKYLTDKNFEIVDIFAINLNYEKEKQNYNWRQKLADRLTAKERKWVYKPHLVGIVKNK